MERIFTRTFACMVVLCALLCPPAHSQNYSAPSVTVSMEKVRVEGVICYSHRVLEKQTIYSICKAYGTNEEALYSVNKGLKENGLKKDSFVFIPVDSCNMPGIVQETKEEDSGTSLEKEENISENTVTPAKDKVKHTEAGAGANSDQTHIVRWYEDLNSIAEKYGVSPESIIKANGLKSSKLKPRQVLVIPASGTSSVEEKDADIEVAETQDTENDTYDQDVEDASENDSFAQNETESEDLDIPADAFTPKDKVCMTFLLPLKATSGGNDGNMDFYSGALLAAKDKSLEGLGIDMNVYDISTGIPSIPEETIMNTDVIIGPISSSDISSVLAKLPEDQFVVSPLDPRVESLAEQHSNLIQAPTPSTEQYKDMIEWIKEDRQENDKVIVFYEKGSKETAESSSINTLLRESGMEYETFSYGILEGRNIISSATSMMSAEGNNLVIVASEKEAFVNDVVRNLNLLIHNQLKVTLYGPSKFRSFETIEVDNFHNTNFHTVMTYNVDYSNEKVKSFILRFRALYNTEPTAFAFQGYDLTDYFISMCAKYGDRWHEMLDKEKYCMLQEDIQFTKTSGGYVNSATKRVVYGPDYSIRQL